MNVHENVIVDKISKLLALAENQEGLPEGELAAQLAEKIMRRHAISMSDVELAAAKEMDPIVDEAVKTGYLKWRKILLNEIARHCSCRVYTLSGDRPGKSTRRSVCKVVGHKSNVDVTHYLFEICMRQIERAAKAYVKDLPSWTDSNYKKSKGLDFRLSAVSGFSYKLEEIRKAADAGDIEGTAMVLHRAQQVDNWLEENMTLGKARKTKARSYNAEGYQAGKDVQLTPGVGADVKPVREIS